LHEKLDGEKFGGKKKILKYTHTDKLRKIMGEEIT